MPFVFSSSSSSSSNNNKILKRLFTIKNNSKVSIKRVDNVVLFDEINYDFKTKMKINSKSEIIYSSQNTIQKNVPIYHKIVLENFKTNQIDYQIHYLNYLKYKYVSRKKWISELIINASTQRTIEQRSNQKNNSSIYRKYPKTHKF